MGRADDHPGAALAYYASRGETRLAWGGRGAERLGLAGAVTDGQSEAIFGPGGACDPILGVRLAGTRRPGVEIVVAAHKSLAMLGLLGRAEDMHQILDAERDATPAFLEEATLGMGGRRGRAAVPTATSGLVYAVTRHATSRAGDPNPHDHVLIANAVEMLDGPGGWTAADTALWRDCLHAATMTGRVTAARRAVELGYAIERDDGPSGRLGHWRIAGVPHELEEVFSKRAAEIDQAVAGRGAASYRARQVAARDTRSAKREEPVADRVARWTAEAHKAGHDLRQVDRLVVDAARSQRTPQPLAAYERAEVAGRLLAADGPLATKKVFARLDVTVAAAPFVCGRPAGELDRVVARVLADPEAVPLVGVAGARERAFACASVIAMEAAIADTLARGTAPTGTGELRSRVVEGAVERKDAELGPRLTAGQGAMVRGICSSGRQVELVLGVAGAGKNTALDVVRAAYEAAGYQVVGTATSGQAARSLAEAAGIGEPHHRLPALAARP